MLPVENIPLLSRLLQLKLAEESYSPKEIRNLLNENYKLSLSEREIILLLNNSYNNNETRNFNTVTRIPELSIIIPVYETEKYIRECIESLVNQTEKNIELIFVDDCSPDLSSDIILEYMLKDERILIVKNTENIGLLRTRQSGVKFSSGKYIAHVDSDDYVSVDCYRKALKRASETSADIIQFGMVQVHGEKLKPHRVSVSQHTHLEGIPILEAFLKSEINFSVCNKLYKRDLWVDASDQFPKKSFMVEDLSQNLVLMYKASTYASISDICYYYRITPDTDSRSKDAYSLGWRAYSAARHIAKIKLILKDNNDLTSFWPLIGLFEKKVYFDYFRPLIRSCGILEDTGADTKVSNKSECLLWIRKIYRINGYLPIRRYIATDDVITKEIIKISGSSRANQPVVSIIIPVYNISDYLTECVVSAMNQTLTNIEIIIVNDASTDTSPNIISDLQRYDSRIRRIDHLHNKGLLQSRLSGVKIARGKYVSHLDGDDYIEPDMLEKMFERAEEKGSDVVQCGYQTVDGAKTKPVLCRKIHHMKSTDVLKNFLKLDGVSNCMWNKLYRRELWEVSTPYFPEITYKAEDVCLNSILMSFATHLEHVAQPFYNYRIRHGSGDRIQDSHNICFRAISACYNMRQIEYVISTFRRPEYFSEALQSRRNNYFQRTINTLIDFSKKDSRKAARTLAECYYMTDWTYAKQVANLIQRKQPRARPAGKSQLSKPHPKKVRAIEKRFIKLFWTNREFLKYTEDRNQFFKDSKHYIFRMMAK